MLCSLQHGRLFKRKVHQSTLILTFVTFSPLRFAWQQFIR